MSTQIGSRVESWVAEQLQSKGFKCVARNVRTRWSEIDLIVSKSSIGLIFIEVKYRSGDFHGSGENYITPQKLARMRRAALVYVSTTSYGGDYYLAVVSVSRLSSKMYLVE